MQKLQTSWSLFQLESFFLKHEMVTTKYEHKISDVICAPIQCAPVQCAKLVLMNDNVDPDASDEYSRTAIERCKKMARGGKAAHFSY